MNKIEEREIALGTVVFHFGSDSYHAYYQFPASGFPRLDRRLGQDESRWRLSKTVCQRPGVQQKDRHTRIGVFDSLEDCRTQVVKEVGGDRLRQAIEAGMVVIAGRSHAKIMAPPGIEDLSDDDLLAILDAASEMIRELKGMGFEQVDG